MMISSSLTKNSPWTKAIDSTMENWEAILTPSNKKTSSVIFIKYCVSMRLPRQPDPCPDTDSSGHLRPPEKKAEQSNY
jgi:hypothetical protein